MTAKVYIDGQAGTTGLVIYDFLDDRDDIEVLRLPDAERKNESARQDAISQSDLTILCLPDDASEQATQWAVASNTKLIDASTAHRVSEGWTYGLPELGNETREEIRNSSLVSNPGCYPTGVILMLRPLIAEGIIAAESPIIVHALSGYSGGGRQLIERWEDPNLDLLSLPFSTPYALDRVHKHIPEMMKYSGLRNEPQFLPRVGPFLQGMRVEIPLHASLFNASGNDVAEQISNVLFDRYQNESFVGVTSVSPDNLDEFQLNPCVRNGTNRIEIFIYNHPSGHVLLVAILDNLGKGAGGTAVQSMNLMLGFDESAGFFNDP